MVRLIAGASTGIPIALFEDQSVVFLRGERAGVRLQANGYFKGNPPFNPLDLTDEDNVMLMKVILNG